MKPSTHIKHRKDVTLVQVIEDGTSIWAWLVLEGWELVQLDVGYTEPELLHGLTVGDKNNLLATQSHIIQ